MECKHCGNKTDISYSPKEIFSLAIPFTQIEVKIWNWKSKEYMDICEDCLFEMSENHHQEIFDAGKQFVIDKLYKDGLIS